MPRTVKRPRSAEAPHTIETNEKPNVAPKAIKRSASHRVAATNEPVRSRAPTREKPKTLKTVTPKKVAKKVLPLEEIAAKKQNIVTITRKNSTKENTKENRRKREPVIDEESATDDDEVNDPSDSNNNHSEGVKSVVLPKKAKQSILPSHDRGFGKVLAWGQNDVGQIGCEPEVPQKKFPGLVQFFERNGILTQEVCAGAMHTAVLSSSGEVYTFGCNDEKALGRVTEEEEECFKPGKVNLPDKVVQISTGDSHVCALTEYGHVYAWGTFRDVNGSMGLIPRSKEPQVHPQFLSKDLSARIMKISSGANHIAMLSDDGIVYTCGTGEQGQLGRTYNSAARITRSQKVVLTEREFWLTPQAVMMKSKVKFNEIWTGNFSTYGRTHKFGDILVFGLNNHNQLGIEKKGDDAEHIVVKAVTKSVGFKGNKWAQISAGEHHCVALTTEGKVYSVGRQEDGRLGLGPGNDAISVPTLVPALANEKCVQVACGLSQGYAVTENGRLYCWGFGENYQLGSGADDDSNIPMLCEGPKQKLLDYKVIFISGGGQHATMIAIPPPVAANKADEAPSIQPPPPTSNSMDEMKKAKK